MRGIDSKFLTIYEIDENFFKTIDTEEKAYILGFIYANGCNHVKPNRCVSLTQLEQAKFY